MKIGYFCVVVAITLVMWYAALDSLLKGSIFWFGFMLVWVLQNIWMLYKIERTIKVLRLPPK